MRARLRLLRTSTAASMLGVLPRTLNKWTNEGRIQKHSPGFYTLPELERFISEGPRQKEKAPASGKTQKPDAEAAH